MAAVAASRRWLGIAGVVLVLAGGIGFMTVADDVRHGGEIVGVGTISLAGVLLLLAAGVRSSSVRRALLWLAGLPVGGAVAGAVADRVGAGAGAGLFLGILVACWVWRQEHVR
jgi:hypothetical protein